MLVKTRELDEGRGYALLDLVLVLGREGGEGLGLGVPDRGKIHVQQISETEACQHTSESEKGGRCLISAHVSIAEGDS